MSVINLFLLQSDDKKPFTSNVVNALKGDINWVSIVSNDTHYIE